MPLVFVDHRGAGEPQALVCPAPQNLDSISDPAVTNACGRSLGPRRTHFNSANIPRDLSMVKTALNIAKWSMWGVSYGAAVVTECIRMFPTDAKTCVLDSAYVLSQRAGRTSEFYQTSNEVARSVCERANVCEVDACLQNLRTVLKDLRLNPRQPDVLGSLFNIVFNPISLVEGNMSKVLESAANGKCTNLEALVLETETSVTPFFGNRKVLLFGFLKAINCLESALAWGPYADKDEQLAKFEGELLRANPEEFDPFLPEEVLKFSGVEDDCLGWPKLPEGVNFNDLVPCPTGPIDNKGVPVLMMNGEYDLLTTVADGRRATMRFKFNARFAKVASAGLSIGRISSCGSKLGLDFVRSGRLPNTSRCSNPATQPLLVSSQLIH